MLTGRAWWLVVVAFFLFALSVFFRTAYAVNILSVTVLAWFSFEWVRFRLRADVAIPRLRAHRRLKAGGREASAVWAGRPFTVTVEVELDCALGLPYVALSDPVPGGAAMTAGSARLVTPLTSSELALIEYNAVCAEPGVMRFEGVEVQAADVNGFFYRRVFLRDPVEVTVLPPLVDDEGQQRVNKRANVLLPPGEHRLRQPGGGAELLDLRDYRPGDPPKMVAWKASAKRDRLITKEFENEVPVRVTLFLDASESVRLGPPGRNALARLVTIGSGVAQASAARRDLVGLTVFDEGATETVRPSRGRRHLVGLMRKLSEAAGRDPSPAKAELAPMMRTGLNLADRVYPDLIRGEANRTPWKMYWRPLLDRGWAWIVLLMFFMPLLVLFSRPYRWLVTITVTGIEPAAEFVSVMKIIVALSPALIAGLFWVFFGFSAMLGLSKVPEGRPAEPSGGVGSGIALLTSGVVLVALLWLGGYEAGCMILLAFVLLFGSFWLLFRAFKLKGTSTKQLNRRKRLAALVARHNGVGPGGVALLMTDDYAMGRHLQRFLSDHRARYPVPLHDADGRYLHRGVGKIDMLTKALTFAVSRAKDNEVYVLLADLMELDDAVGPLVKAVKSALARHHAVVLICPWPPHVPPPDQDRPAVRSAAELLPADLDRVESAFSVGRLHAAFRRVRREFSRLGVPVVRADEGDPVALILRRVEQLKGVAVR